MLVCSLRYDLLCFRKLSRCHAALQSLGLERALDRQLLNPVNRLETLSCGFEAVNNVFH